MDTATFLEIAQCMRRDAVLPRMCATSREGNDMFHSGREVVWLSDISVDWLFAKPACPSVQFEKNQMVDMVAPQVHLPSLWAVILYFVLSQSVLGHI